MGRQREQLEATNQYLNDTSTLTGQARQILQDMYVFRMRKVDCWFDNALLTFIHSTGETRVFAKRVSCTRSLSCSL